MRRYCIAAALLVAGCHAPNADPMAAADDNIPATTTSPSPLAACRADSAGVVVTTDRGIGGTGIGGTGIGGGTADLGPAGERRDVADRGIGGTGVDGIGGTGVDGGIGGTGITANAANPARSGRTVLALRGRSPSERGDSGTGVVGTVTGFRSLCVNGLEVGLQGIGRLNEDGATLTSAHLQLGQIAALDTRGSGTAMHAVGIGIRHEVSGPITAISRPAQELEVAGQRVLLNGSTHGTETAAAAALNVGDWVAISGLRDLAGDIHASRLDRRDPGEVIVAGRPELHGNEWTLGRLRLRFVAKPPLPGQRVLLAGRWTGGALGVDRAVEDRLVSGSHSSRHLIVEGFTQRIGGDLRLGQGLRAAIGPRFGAPPPEDRPAIVDLLADSANNMVAVSWSFGGTPGSAAPPGKTAAGNTAE